MKQVIGTERVPVKLWLDDIEEEALQQAYNLANLPFIFKHIAVMPDSHFGYGMPIGAIMATSGVVVPNAVGVDIGCGMCAVKTSLLELDKETRKKIIGGSKVYKGGIRTKIPLGQKHHSKKQDESLMPDGLDWDDDNLPIVKCQYYSALRQLGTLGGGNHFIELQKGSDGYIWIMIHSGSRNLGYTVAHHYNKMAIVLNEKWHVSVPKKHQLAFLPLDSQVGVDYLKEMQYCIDFAKASRALMMERVIESMMEVCGDFDYNLHPLDVSHNHAVYENHFGKNVMIHRKGATKAYEGQQGIIPGSQGSPSYIVLGKGNVDSFMSCSHGAGRLMSRTQAKNTLDLEAELKILNDQGIIHSVRGKHNLDEATGSYKDIQMVINNQMDLIDIEVKLQPLACIKG